MRDRGVTMPQVGTVYLLLLDNLSSHGESADGSVLCTEEDVHSVDADTEGGRHRLRSLATHPAMSAYAPFRIVRARFDGTYYREE
jgi:hypothetical protein